MLKCVLIDDELPALRYLQALCHSIGEVEVVQSFDDPIKFLAKEGLEFDTCILDINMPEMDGLSLAKKLKGKAIIFSTAYKEYAADAFDLNAADYLRKPYQIDRLKHAFEKAERWLDHSRSILAKRLEIELNTSIGRTKVEAYSVQYIVVASNDRRDKEIYMENGQVLLAKNITLDELLDLLPSDKFCRVNRKTLVKVDIVQSRSQDAINCLLSDGHTRIQFSLSEQSRDKFLALWSPH